MATDMIINTTIMDTITVQSMTTTSMRLMATIMGIMLTRILIRTIMDKITGTAMSTHIPTTIMATTIPILIPTRRGNFSPTRRSTATTSFSDWR